VPGVFGQGGKVEDERHLALVSDQVMLQCLSEVLSIVQLHTYGASCQTRCHCEMGGDVVALRGRRARRIGRLLGIDRVKEDANPKGAGGKPRSFKFLFEGNSIPLQQQEGSIN
jgi:hypothetical protein